MGFSRERPGKGGKPRCVALYRDLKARQRSAGTYASRLQADRVGDPAKSRLTFHVAFKLIESAQRRNYSRGGRRARCDR